MKELISDINIENYDYELPEERIAQYPLAQRDQSKLLICKEKKISENIFSSIENYLPENSLLIFNDTKVIHARLHFKKETGSEIEIFCLEPVMPSTDHQIALSAKSGVIWKCMVGNNKKWKQGKLTLKEKDIVLTAEKIEQSNETFLIKFEWQPADLSFASIIETIGKIPLPPYISRQANDSDNLRYQTVFAHYEGSVAAPTAGLHFTEKIFSSLHNKNIKTSFITLHVGAGTFKPVSSSQISEHQMHTETFSVSKKIIEEILSHPDKIIAVGTTSVRTLESLYYVGINLVHKKENAFTIEQWNPYQSDYTGIPVNDALHAIINYCNKNKTDVIHGSTRIIIIPGFQYKIVNEIITNFHQPRSTLLLLVSAFIGTYWKNVYDYALNNNFRFLSYGDVCYFKP
ncbi:MAG TPA: S-adenosylmethionine:tRNA ribosyltransferase-isomerase [Bacteroidales bacterium]|nr:S-adenosylmethionine:tRNA ribosyltransferase-isomerase [Bacteroidales bacterium]HPS16098.1 S-adenosylmethionine:tRNA ribosyltransferase-isomerase [Bacteroidales bacterium]